MTDRKEIEADVQGISQTAFRNEATPGPPQPTRIRPLAHLSRRLSPGTHSVGARLASLKAGRGLRLPAPPRLWPLPSQTLAPPHLGSGLTPSGSGHALSRLRPRPTQAPPHPSQTLAPPLTGTGPALARLRQVPPRPRLARPSPTHHPGPGHVEAAH